MKLAPINERVYDKEMNDKFENLMGVCCYCKQPLNNAQGHPIDNLVMSKDGIAHKNCNLKNKDLKELKIAVMMNCYSIGDTISVTPTLREIKRLYPDCRLDIITLVPEIFKYNKHVNKIIKWSEMISETLLHEYDVVLEPFQPTNMNINHHWNTHSVDYCTLTALKKELKDEDKHYEMPYTSKEVQNMKQVCINNGLNVDQDSFLLVHPHDAEWQTRSWGSKNWIDLIKEIKQTNPTIKIVSIGGSRNEYKDHEMKNYVKAECIDLYNKLTILESLALMDCEKARCLITMDTSPIHIAGCSKELAVIGLFTLVNSKYRVPYRRGHRGYKFFTVDSECCCTYDMRPFTTVIYFQTCPKLDFLNNVSLCFETNDFTRFVNYQNLIQRLKNFYPMYDWTEGDHIPQMIKELKLSYAKQIPCMPSVSSVMNIVKHIIK